MTLKKLLLNTINTSVFSDHSIKDPPKLI